MVSSYFQILINYFVLNMPEENILYSVEKTVIIVDTDVFRTHTKRGDKEKLYEKESTVIPYSNAFPPTVADSP